MNSQKRKLKYYFKTSANTFNRSMATGAPPNLPKNCAKETIL